MQKLVFVAAIFAVIAAGCASSRVTNLTTTRQPRNATGLYPVEFQWETSQQSVIQDSLKPQVVIGYDFYPMRPSLGIANRWEAVIPLAADKTSVIYHFKVDYQYRSLGKPEKGSRLSSSYKLDILDR